MENLQIFSYGESPIKFKDVGGEVFVDATAMAKKFEKKPESWLRTRKAKEYIELRSKSLKCDLVLSNHGGNEKGTWFHKELAFRFAQWLSTEFEIWVDNLLKKIAEDGVFINKAAESVPDKTPEVSYEEVARLRAESKLSSKMADSMDSLLKAWDAHKEIEKAYNSGSVSELPKSINKVEESEEARVIQKETTVLTLSSRDSNLSMEDLAAKLELPNFGRNKMMEFFRVNGVLKGSNKPYRKYIDNGWFTVAESKWKKPDGTEVVDLVSRVNPDKIGKIKDWIIKNQQP